MSVQPLTMTPDELAGLSVERLDKFVGTRQRHLRDASPDEEERRRLSDELDRLLDARKVAEAREAGAAKGPGKLIVDGVAYPVPEKLTMGEAADLEEIVGADPQGANVRLMLGMTWIALRRKDPTWTLDRVRDLDLDAVQQVAPEADARPPDEAGSSA